MNKRLTALLLGIMLSVSLIASNAFAGYVTGTNTLLFSDPDKTQVFISTSTKSAKGTVVICHGMILVNFEIYADLIIDLTNKGYDVIFPQYQEAGVMIISSMGVLALLGGSAPSHIAWTLNAIDGINWALSAIIPYWYNWYTPVIRKPSTNLYIFAHSIGGAIGYNIPLMSSGLRSKIKGIVLANCVLDPAPLSAGTMPAGISMPPVQLINVQAAGQYVTMPLLFLTGNQDAWGTYAQGSIFMNNAITTNKKALMAIDSLADHMAPATNQGPLFDIMSWAGLTKTMLGGDAEWNYLDTKFYEAAILHLISTGNATTFNPAIPWTNPAVIY